MRAALKVAAIAVVAFYLYQSAGGTGTSHYPAVRFAEAQIGKPYAWGAAGPGSFDCSGLAMMAERAAGYSIPRTTFAEWADLRHVTSPKPGDLAFFAGGDGTMSNPGHVGIVVNPKRDLMVDAPQPGMSVEYDSYAGSPDLVGFADPASR